MVVQLDRLLRE